MRPGPFAYIKVSIVQFTPLTQIDFAALSSAHVPGCSWHRQPADMPLAVRAGLCDYDLCGASQNRHATVCLTRLAAVDPTGIGFDPATGNCYVGPLAARDYCYDYECCVGCASGDTFGPGHGSIDGEPCPGLVWLVEHRRQVPSN